MSTIWLVLSFLLAVIGLIGCFLPVIPGPFIAYCGVLCMLLTPHAPSVATLVLFGAVVIGVTILDYVVPAVGAKKFNCSRFGTWGCVLGTVVGVFFLMEQEETRNIRNSSIAKPLPLLPKRGRKNV